MDQPRFVVLDRYADLAYAWPYAVRDNLTAEVTDATDYKDCAEQRAAEYNRQVAAGTFDA